MSQVLTELREARKHLVEARLYAFKSKVARAAIAEAQEVLEEEIKVWEEIDAAEICQTIVG